MSVYRCRVDVTVRVQYDFESDASYQRYRDWENDALEAAFDQDLVPGNWLKITKPIQVTQDGEAF